MHLLSARNHQRTRKSMLKFQTTRIPGLWFPSLLHFYEIRDDNPTALDHQLHIYLTLLVSYSQYQFLHQSHRSQGSSIRNYSLYQLDDSFIEYCIEYNHWWTYYQTHQLSDAAGSAYLCARSVHKDLDVLWRDRLPIVILLFLSKKYHQKNYWKIIH